MNMKKLENETQWEYGLRVIKGKVNREIDLDWDEICDLLNLDVHKDSLRKATSVTDYSGVAVANYYEDKIAQMSIELQPKEIQDDILQATELKIQELKKERYKLNDESRRLHNLLRTEARWEKIVEYLHQTVESYRYEPSDYVAYKRYEGGKNEATLLLSDWHIGSEFHTFHNTYGLDVAKSRADRLCNDVLEYCELHKIKTLYIEILGDMVSGNIHLTTRLSNNENIIEQIVETSEMLGKFVYEIAKVVPNVKIVYCVGNHGRVNANVKESIAEENFEYLIRWYLESKLAQLDNVEWVYNTIDKEVAYYELDCGRKIASCHGHREKNYKESTKNLAHYFGVCQVDEVHMGHFHNHQVINNVIVNGSFMGTDAYARQLRYHDLPSQTLRVYDDKGNFVTYQINLS